MLLAQTAREQSMLSVLSNVDVATYDERVGLGRWAVGTLVGAGPRESDARMLVARVVGPHAVNNSVACKAKACFNVVRKVCV